MHHPATRASAARNLRMPGTIAGAYRDHVERSASTTFAHRAFAAGGTFAAVLGEDRGRSAGDSAPEPA
jgi:hypothetical protein